MADREHVADAGAWESVALAVVMLFIVGCSEAGSNATEFRGRVIDQDSGRPIAGAIVVGKYMGARGFEGASSCNRVESAVSNQDGWFTLPLDAKDGEPLMEAYHRGYKWGRSPRKAWRVFEGNASHWEVAVYEWDAENRSSRTLSTDPTTYHSHAEALQASRERIDVYLRPFSGDRERRLDELHRVSNAGSCGASHRTTLGPVPFFEAIYQEQVELGDSARSLEITQNDIRSAEFKFAQTKATR